MAALGMLSAGLAHEMSNPLAYVITNLRYLAEELPRLVAAGAPSADAAAEFEQTLADALEGATRVSEMVGDLRDYSRKSTDRLESVDVRALLDRACALVKAELRRRARLFKDYEGTPFAWANEAQVAHVFVALLVHAARAIPDGASGKHEVRVACRSAGENVEVEVRHNGPSSDSAEALDLAVCRSVVESFGGRATFETEVTGETVLKVTLPECARERESVPTRAA